MFCQAYVSINNNYIIQVTDFSILFNKIKRGKYYEKICGNITYSLAFD